jgi:hypothetical protein
MVGQHAEAFGELVSVADPQGIGVQSDKNAASACLWADIIVQIKNEIAKGHTWCQRSAADRGVH